MRTASSPSARGAEPPLAVLDRVQNARRITSLNAAARAFGLKTGDTEADAKARVPHLLCEDAAPGKDRLLLEAVADWCDRYTPLVALDGADGLFLDITGCAHLFGGEDQLLQDIAGRLQRQGFQLKAAIAGTPGAAWAAARYGDGGTSPSGNEAGLLSALPVAALRIDAGTAAGLNRVGLTRIGQVLDRPRAPLARRFGPDLMRRLDQALGREGEPISPRFEAPLVSAERRFFEPIGQLDDIKAVALSLAGQVCAALERRLEGGRAFELLLFRADGAVQKLMVGTSAALRDPKRILRLFDEKLKADESVLDAGYGYDLIRLGVIAADSAPSAQASLDGRGVQETQAALETLVDRLGARLGIERITRLLPVGQHLPEWQTEQVPAALAREEALSWIGFGGEDLGLGPPAGNPHNSLSGFSGTGTSETVSSHSGFLARPLRLIDPAELVEALAMVPEGPPLRFRWRRSLYQVARSEGPERIAPPWWIGAVGQPLETKEVVTRDYFRIEDTEGRRFWLYREGLYGRETAQPRWYVQGLFA
ncbi:protein ImuB [Roseibium denhamense]|uniref:Protein ImuB n=1 Tax=Roseibium denhamense TaxID=76305 RepID=A0ABY1P879_9HYPH|nr:protein ImuB [Roseibium denhamense]